jgi:hypothetical protein
MVKSVTDTGITTGQDTSLLYTVCVSQAYFSHPILQWYQCRHFAGPPSARAPQNLTVVAGLDVYLRCPVAGFPISSVTWQRAGDILPIHLRQRVFSNGTLLVRQIEGATDKGEYSCSVSNQQGQAAHGRLYLDVMSTYHEYTHITIKL